MTIERKEKRRENRTHVETEKGKKETIISIVLIMRVYLFMSKY